MDNLLMFLGDNSVPYRTIMANHDDFIVQGHLIRKKQVVIAEQTHSNHVHICSENDSGAGFDNHLQIADCDALLTNLPNQFLMVRTADCTPILVYDNIKKVVGAIHSGREGTKKNIVGQTIETMQIVFNSNPGDICASMGAGICKTHYNVSDNIWNEFYETCVNNKFIIKKPDRPFLDIQRMIFQQLIGAGLALEKILRNNICTFEADNYFSFRRDGTHNRQINIIGIKDGRNY